MSPTLNIFTYEDYKEFLRDFESPREKIIRGFRTRLATEIGCQSGYISHVLGGSAHLSLEQAHRLRNFFGFDEKSHRYFLTLVQRSRAGSQELAQFLTKDLEGQRVAYSDIKQRIGSTRTLSEVDQAIYYSSWIYAAVHVLFSIPAISELDQMAKTLRVSEKTVSKVTEFLLSKGLIKEVSSNNSIRFTVGETQLHLDSKSSFISQHHQNGRIAAIHSLSEVQGSVNPVADLHYTTFSSMSKKDAEKLKEEMMNLIKKYVEVVRESKDEVAMAFAIDFFRFG